MTVIMQFIKYLESERASCLASAEALSGDDRGDEAGLMKIRANIFDIAASVARTAGQRFPQDPVSFINEKLREIPKSWKTSLEAAERHGDYAKCAAERVKLRAIGEIGQKFTDMAVSAL